MTASVTFVRPSLSRNRNRASHPSSSLSSPSSPSRSNTSASPATRKTSIFNNTRPCQKKNATPVQTQQTQQSQSPVPLSTTSTKVPLLLLAFALITLFVTQSSYAAKSTELTGQAQVVDGDTIILYKNKNKNDKTRIRLRAVDAPEVKQICIHKRSKKSIACGIIAKQAAQSLVDSSRGFVRCIPSPHPDRYGRVVATCMANDVDIGGRLVSDGLALAYRQYGTQYVEMENKAKAAKRGVWATNFEMPWDWRRTHKYTKK